MLHPLWGTRRASVGPWNDGDNRADGPKEKKVNQPENTTEASDVRKPEVESAPSASGCYASWQCGKCGYPLVAGTCDNGCETFPEDELTKLKQQVRAFLEWFNLDGSPCDGFRFREECDKLRQMVGE